MSDQRELLAQWSQSQGNLRRFLEDRALPPLDDAAQRALRDAQEQEWAGEEEGEHLHPLDGVTQSPDT